MRTRRGIVAAALAVAAAGCALQARAEVSAETDAFGNYSRVIVLANSSLKNLKVWSVLRERAGAHPLNPLGDANGDQWPFIAENPVDGNRPWVLWSRFDGSGYGLAWSRWIPDKGWTAVSWLEDSPSPVGDDLDPRVAFDSTGRAVVTWWRNDEGTGRVYLSLYLATRWMTPYLVSDVDVDSRDPIITVLSDTSFKVEFDTPGGHVVRIVEFRRPATITDDIDPFGRFTNGNSSSSGSGSSSSGNMGH
jgi:hypothetical protein